jgi:hypothetical protein
MANDRLSMGIVSGHVKFDEALAYSSRQNSTYSWRSPIPLASSMDAHQRFSKDWQKLTISSPIITNGPASVNAIHYAVALRYQRTVYKGDRIIFSGP